MPAVSIRQQWFACKFVSGDDENTVGFGVGDVDDTQIPSTLRLTDGNAGSVMTGAVLAGRQQHVLDLVLGDTMPAQVREAGIRVPEEPQSHL